jgi:hypothetical protein
MVKLEILYVEEIIIWTSIPFKGSRKQYSIRRGVVDKEYAGPLDLRILVV